MVYLGRSRRQTLARSRLMVTAFVLALVLTGCGGEDAVQSAPTSSPEAGSTASPERALPTATMSEPTATTAPFPIEPLPEAENAADALANLERSISQPGYVYYAQLQEVNTGAIDEPSRTTPVWSAEVWVDMERAASRTEYRPDPEFDEPMMMQPAPGPPAATIYAGDRAYRLYDSQVWVAQPESCLGMDQPGVAVAFICDLATSPWQSGSVFSQSEENGELFLAHDVEFEGQPAVMLGAGEFAMSQLFLDPETYLPLGWTTNLMESGTRVTTITFEFVPASTVEAQRFDPASIGYTAQPLPSGPVLIRRDVLANEMRVPDIFIVNLDGSGEVNLSNDPGFDAGASWSPDGERVAFSSERDGNREVYVVNADGSSLTNLTNNPTYDFEPVWSPDGTRIVFESDRDENNFGELYVMDADGSYVVRISPADIPGNALWPAWSPDGERVAFGSEMGVHVVNADGTGPQLVASPGFSAFLNWTPDGERLIFSASQSGYSDIFVVNSDGSNLINLTDSAADDSRPTLSPDGELIVFYSDRDNPSGSRDGYLMNVDGSEPRRLTIPLSTSTCEVGCDWSPDGAWIVATMLDPQGLDSPLVLISADGSTVVPTDITAYDPQWSPAS